MDSKPAFTSRYWNVQDTLMHARVSTNRPRHSQPTIVLIHGLVVTSTYMMRLGRELAPHYPVMIPDMPGFGKSAREHIPPLNVRDLAFFLKHWIRTARLQNVLVVANSFACEYALAYAEQSPPELKGMMLTGIMKNARMSRAGYLLRWTIATPLEPLSLFPIIIKDALQAGPKRAFKTAQYALTDNTEDRAPSVTAPTLLVRGGKDLLVSRRFMSRFQQAMPIAEITKIAGASHAVNYSNPRELRQVLDAFIKRYKLAQYPTPTTAKQRRTS